MRTEKNIRITGHILGLAVVGLVIFSRPVSAEYVPTDTTVLRWLDKVTGRVSTLEAWVGDTASIGTLAIEVQTCMTRPPEEAPESAAFLKIWDKRPDQTPIEVFSGWMFASSPALSAMDHAVYDVWVLDCENRRRSISE
ncbi:MAG: DUF2155 domain-containing protein [Alphaproteobacteria bacterium]|nr:DUF2155 domain-containing protein [Alphaproteobacteria bacterium]